jgi:hypothetical protein
VKERKKERKKEAADCIGTIVHDGGRGEEEERKAKQLFS